MSIVLPHFLVRANMLRNMRLFIQNDTIKIYLNLETKFHYLNVKNQKERTM